MWSASERWPNASWMKTPARMGVEDDGVLAALHLRRVQQRDGLLRRLARALAQVHHELEVAEAAEADAVLLHVRAALRLRVQAQVHVDALLVDVRALRVGVHHAPPSVRVADGRRPHARRAHHHVRVLVQHRLLLGERQRARVAPQHRRNVVHDRGCLREFDALAADDARLVHCLAHLRFEAVKVVERREPPAAARERADVAADRAAAPDLLQLARPVAYRGGRRLLDVHLHVLPARVLQRSIDPVPDALVHRHTRPFRHSRAGGNPAALAWAGFVTPARSASPRPPATC